MKGSGANHYPRAPAQDGSNNMTCLPLSLKPVRYFCACVSEKSDLNTGIGWDEWEENTGSESTKRSLCDTQAGWCLDGMFSKNLVYLVKTYAPLDSQITVSSVLDHLYSKEKVRLEYNGHYCAWVKANDDASPWMKFDLNGVQYVTSYHVSSSGDDVTWSYIATDVQTVYEGIFATWWFDMEVSARSRRVEPLTFVKYASIQVDILGYMQVMYMSYPGTL